jgi:hypothetical protein
MAFANLVSFTKEIMANAVSTYTYVRIEHIATVNVNDFGYHWFLSINVSC